MSFHVTDQLILVAGFSRLAHQTQTVLKAAPFMVFPT